MTFLMAILGVALATGTQHPYLGAFIMIVIGAVTFLVGFKQYREYRILVEVPRAHVVCRGAGSSLRFDCRQL